MSSIRRYTRLVLVMFVLSVLNISLQLPVHAAMQQNMQMSQGMAMMDHSQMGHGQMDHALMDHGQMQSMDMQDCGCPPALCEAVDAQQDQLGQSQSSLALMDMVEFHPVLVIVEKDSLSQLSDLSFQFLSWQYHQINPPPILLTTELQI